MSCVIIVRVLVDSGDQGHSHPGDEAPFIGGRATASWIIHESSNAPTCATESVPTCCNMEWCPHQCIMLLMYAGARIRLMRAKTNVLSCMQKIMLLMHADKQRLIVFGGHAHFSISDIADRSVSRLGIVVAPSTFCIQPSPHRSPSRSPPPRRAQPRSRHQPPARILRAGALQLAPLDSCPLLPCSWRWCLAAGAAYRVTLSLLCH